MARIFVSYKRQDKDIVYPIVEEIKQNTGIDCWIDLEGIESGDQFQNVIIDAIDNADIVVFMLSKNFIIGMRLQERLILRNRLSQRRKLCTHFVITND